MTTGVQRAFEFSAEVGNTTILFCTGADGISKLTTMHDVFFVLRKFQSSCCG